METNLLQKSAISALPFPVVDWLLGEEIALTLPAGLTVSEWAAAHREFPEDASSPGRWDPYKAPYTSEPMDAFNDPQVERITLVAGARSVKTEIWLNMLGYAIDQDPAPALVVSPGEKKTRRMCRRITKMVKASPALRRYVTSNPDDLQKQSILLKHMEVIFATAGSAADLGEFEAKYILETETDTYLTNVAGQGSPTQMAEMRARTFFDRKIITESKPTTDDGFITKDYLRSDQRKYLVPCPHCGGYQVLNFWQVKHRGGCLGEWPKDKRDSDYIKSAGVAVYECIFCQSEIEEHHKPEMLATGVWAALPASLSGAEWVFEIPMTGEKPPPAPPSSHRGYWWNALYSPFATWAEMAAKFFEVKDDREQYRTFVNEWLGFPFKETIKAVAACSLVEGEDSLCTARPELEVPDNVVALTLGADNHKRGLAVTVWAWERLALRLYKRHLIRYGWLNDFAELETWLFQDVYHNRDGTLIYRIWRAALDTGGGEGFVGDATLTEQAYTWIRSRGRGVVQAIKGASGRFKTGNHMHGKLLDKLPGGKPLSGGLWLWSLDTHALKDAFWSEVEAGRVSFHLGTGEDFARQLTSEAREWDQKTKEWLWKQQGNQPNHYLDASIYAAAMADPECRSGLDVLPKPLPVQQETVENPINPLTLKPRGTFFKRR